MGYSPTPEIPDPTLVPTAPEERVGEVAGAVNRTTEQQTAGQTATSDVRPALRDSVTLSATATDKQAALAAKVIKKSASWADVVRGSTVTADR